jgi:hypothetical protein
MKNVKLETLFARSFVVNDVPDKKLIAGLVPKMSVAYLGGFHLYEKLKFDPEIVKYVVNVIENLVKKCDKKEINKLELASNILIKVWDLKEEQDLDILVKQIKVLNNNGAIQKVSKSKKKYGKYFKQWIIKKLS